MRILIDTNIFIYRENYHIIPSNLQFLLKTLNDLVVQILVHPLSAHEIEGDKNQERRKVILSKIKKAYLSHSRIRKMSEGDILLFYRSVDERRITSLGVIEKVYHNIKNPDEIIRYVGKRSVYTKKEIEEIAKNPTKVILFRQHFHLRNPLALDFLRTNAILIGAPQSIVRISHEKYLLIKQGGGINERFTIN